MLRDEVVFSDELELKCRRFSRGGKSEFELVKVD